MLLLKCPKCKHDMKCQPNSKNLKGKRKICVYCGKSFSVKNNIVKAL